MAKHQDERRVAETAPAVPKVRVRVRPGGAMIKISRREYAHAGDWFMADASDMANPQFRKAVQTEEEAGSADKRAQDAAAPRQDNETFLSIRNAMRAQREVRRQAHEADERRAVAEFAVKG